MVAEFEQLGKVFGTVVIAIDINAVRHASDAIPYDALIYVPGRAPGAINFGRLVLRNSAASRERDFDLHLKSPRPNR
jgi:hypothetical protein